MPETDSLRSLRARLQHTQRQLEDAIVRARAAEADRDSIKAEYFKAGAQWEDGLEEAAEKLRGDAAQQLGETEKAFAVRLATTRTALLRIVDQLRDSPRAAITKSRMVSA